jgi:phospholipid-translocating ATPase
MPSSQPPRPNDNLQGAETSNPHLSSSSPSRPQLHIDTNPALTSTLSINSTPPRSRDGRRASFNNDPATPQLSGSPSIRSQRSDQPRVRFSSDVQTLGERTVVSPSITADEALARLHHSPSLSSLNRRPGSVPSEFPHLPVSPPQDHIRGVLRSPSQTSTSITSTRPQQRLPTRPRGWSLRRQLWSKRDPNNSPKSTTEIGLAILPTTQAVPSVEPRSSRSIEDVDAIRVVRAALDEAQVNPPITSIQPKSSSPKKLPMIEPEVTQVSLPFYSSWAASRRTRHMLLERCRGVMRRLKRLRDPRLISKGKGREIPINVGERGKTNLLDDRTGREYVGNLITSSRYTVYSFLPRQLWAQFSKVANL